MVFAKCLKCPHSGTEKAVSEEAGETRIKPGLIFILIDVWVVGSREAEGGLGGNSLVIFAAFLKT